MKKNWLFVMASIPAVGLLASSSGRAKTHIKPGKTINIGINQEFIIALDSDPDTGYDWEENYDESVLNMVDDRYEQDEKAPGLAGDGGTQYFQFKALKAGQTKITLDYKWYWARESLEHKVFYVNIK